MRASALATSRGRAGAWSVRWLLGALRSSHRSMRRQAASTFLVTAGSGVRTTGGRRCGRQPIPRASPSASGERRAASGTLPSIPDSPLWIPTWDAWEELSVHMNRYEGFHEFVRAREQSLMRTAYLLTGNAHLGEDLLQTVLTRVASHWPKLARGGNPEAYARKALVNQTISWRRRRRPEVPGADLPEPPAEAGQPHDEATVRRLALLQALARLTPKQRALIVRRLRRRFRRTGVQDSDLGPR
ncbi:sigma factor [Nonomuraea pusilla]|uniref:sigma factor n=1 Tax=Nonomuraea pusilla TaxID=46177 RepID=UPI00332CDC75